MCVLVLKVIIPDVPKKLQKRIHREAHLTNEIIIKQEMLRARGLRGDGPTDTTVPQNIVMDFLPMTPYNSLMKYADDSSWDSENEGKGMNEVYI